MNGRPLDGDRDGDCECDRDGGSDSDRDRRRRWPVLLALPATLLALLLAGCTSILDRPALTPAGTANLRSGAAATAVTSVSITPVTPDGLLTGPGVTDTDITLAVLADPAGDRGFTEGVRLWQRSVNTGGGLCGRTITVLANGADGVPADPSAAYRSVGASVLGLLTLSAADVGATLGTSIAADQIPAVTPTGTSAQLGPSGPLVAGATADILAINGLDHLRQDGTLAPGQTVGVLSDGSAAAEDALRGARWWAQVNGVSLDVRNAGTDPAAWGGDGVVLALADAPTVGSVVAATPPDVAVLTLPDGFDPQTWSAPTVQAADGRLYVATPAPAYGSAYPAVVAVASMAAAAGDGDIGPRTVDGYAVGATWGRLIQQACDDLTLTRDGIRQATSTVGPATATSLFGAGDPGLVVRSGLPATRVSSISVADASAPAGLRSLAWLESAPGIDDYTP